MNAWHAQHTAHTYDRFDRARGFMCLCGKRAPDLVPQERIAATPMTIEVSSVGEPYLRHVPALEYQGPPLHVCDGDYVCSICGCVWADIWVGN